ncbi:MAG: hypothetical protein EBZ48_15345 [Proteobacteria bacterium]|nr:hypothetical protein [Pseudomonadota bacterium]
MSQIRDFLQRTAAPSRATSTAIAEAFPSSTELNEYDSEPRPTQNRQATITKFSEYELRYIMPLSTVERRVNLESLAQSQITQNYFSRDQLPALRLLAAELLDLPRKTLDGLHITSARVRETVRQLSTGVELEPMYSLDLKGPKGTGESPGRLEISVPIDTSCYQRLLSIADHGVMSKLRYSIDGFVYPAARANTGGISCKAEIDILQSCGRGTPPKLPLSERYNFATIDLEVHTPAALRYALKGQHSFDFLNAEAREFGTLPSKMQAALGTRRMAKAGIDDQVTKSLRKLHQEWA